MTVAFWQWWLLIMVIINTCIHTIVCFVGRKVKKKKK